MDLSIWSWIIVMHSKGGWMHNPNMYLLANSTIYFCSIADLNNFFPNYYKLLGKHIPISFYLKWHKFLTYCGCRDLVDKTFLNLEPTYIFYIQARLNFKSILVSTRVVAMDLYSFLENFFDFHSSKRILSLNIFTGHRVYSFLYNMWID